MTSFATELATPSVTDECTNTLPRLICKDYILQSTELKSKYEMSPYLSMTSNNVTVH